MEEINYKLLYERQLEINREILERDVRLMNANQRLNSKLNAYKAHLELFERQLTLIKRNVDSVNFVQKDDKVNVLSSNAFTTLTTYRISHNPDVNYALVILDIDDFKKVNDTYGHYYGDIALRDFVDILNNSCREELDLVGRFGGDEFVLILENITYENAMKKVRYLLDVIKKNPIQYDLDGQKKYFNISVSAGLVEYNRKINMDNTDEVIDDNLSDEENENRKIYQANFLSADKNLYLAKQQGKGIVVGTQNIPSYCLK